jgi:hypothetical protein
MKSFIRTLGYLTVVAAFGIVSCSKNVANNGASTATDTLTRFITSGTWTISSLLQKTEDNTSQFAGYVFTFSADGTLTASQNGKQTKGSWHYTPAVTYYGSSSKDAINLSMGTDNPFRRLTKTWNLKSKSANLVEMESPEILEDEHLQFQKQ